MDIPINEHVFITDDLSSSIYLQYSEPVNSNFDKMFNEHPINNDNSKSKVMVYDKNTEQHVETECRHKSYIRRMAPSCCCRLVECIW